MPVLVCGPEPASRPSFVTFPHLPFVVTDSSAKGGVCERDVYLEAPGDAGTKMFQLGPVSKRNSVFLDVFEKIA